ncbi:cytochrome P450 2A13-like [Ambystoma mexicanum]|uniref:cytochrome P450 2A13-like n=1 Tax=Ambystoma mexicanum TaxID=8296 RepID=UPI0037E828AC
MLFVEALPAYLLTCIACLLLLSAWRTFHDTSLLPPGPFPLPIIGNLHQIRSSQVVEYLKKLSVKYGPVFTLHLGLRRVVVLWGYDAVKEALVDHADEFSGRGGMPTFQSVLKNSSVTLASGPRWKELRRFSIMTLRNFGMGKKSIEERIQEEATFLIQEFKSTKELPFDPSLHISNATSNVICSIMFGNRFDYQDKEFHQLLSMIRDTFALSSGLWGQLYTMFTSIMSCVPGPHTKMHLNLSSLKRFVEGRVERNRETLDPNAPRDFIDCFLIKMEKEQQNPATEYVMKNLVSTVLGLFIAGTETVSTTIKHGLLLLLKYPAVQEKIHSEIDSVIGRDRIPCAEDRSKMPYTDAVIHEIQRFLDIIPFGLPHMVMRDTKFRGFSLCKGTEVYAVLSSVLQDPTQFENPEQFNPGHFLDENGCFKKNESFMPFSAGKRVCLGEGMARMELFLYITTILQNFQLKFPGDPEGIDIRPRLNGLFRIPVNYELQVNPR